MRSEEDVGWKQLYCAACSAWTGKLEAETEQRAELRGSPLSRTGTWTGTPPRLFGLSLDCCTAALYRHDDVSVSAPLWSVLLDECIAIALLRNTLLLLTQ